MSKMALIILDMLNDFVTGDLKTERATKIIPNLTRLVEAARENGVPVIYSNDAHYENDFEVIRRWGSHALKGSQGAEVIPELEPKENDFIVEKRTYSGFYETGLDSILRGLYGGEGVDTIVLGGLHTHICVRHTSADAFFRGYEIIIASDGVEAFSQSDHEAGLVYLKEVYNAEILRTEDIVEQFNRE